LLLGQKKIAQEDEHHEEHHYNHEAAEEKTHEFTGSGTWHRQFLSFAKIGSCGFVLKGGSRATALQKVAT
jgi:hypothetical protein